MACRSTLVWSALALCFGSGCSSPADPNFPVEAGAGAEDVVPAPVDVVSVPDVTVPDANDSAVVEAGPAQASPVQFSVAGGTYTRPFSVTVTSATPGATIYYSTDGTVPTASSSTAYVGPIEIVRSTTLSAIATAPGYTASPISTVSYVINDSRPKAVSPAFSPPGGTYSVPQTVTLTSATSGAAIYYTMDGTDPTAQSARYASPLSVTSTRMMRAIATASGYDNSPISEATYTITGRATAQSPAISPASGTFTAPTTVTITTLEAGGVTYYSTDGSVPTEVRGTKYTTPFTVVESTTVTAVTYATDKDPSPFTAVRLSFPLPSPMCSVASSTSTVPLLLTLSSTAPSASICYTLDGSDPACLQDGTCPGGVEYSQQDRLLLDGNRPGAGSLQLQAIACLPGQVSAIASFLYVFTAAAPTFTPAASTVAVNSTVALTSTTPGATIFYAINGSSPSCVTGGTQYTVPIAITTTSTVRAIACRAAAGSKWGYNPSPVATATFGIR